MTISKNDGRNSKKAASDDGGIKKTLVPGEPAEAVFQVEAGHCQGLERMNQSL
jgi:hypothetical protein